MKVLVTGAGGFAGGIIINYFMKRGHEVTGVYRHNKPQISGCSLLHMDLSETIKIDKNFDAIIHTACAQPKNTLSVLKRDNIDTMQQLVSYAQKSKIGTFINISTKSVYGDCCRDVDISEEAPIINQDSYGLCKYVAERLLEEAKGIQSISFRVPGLVGRGAHDTWLVRTVQSILNNKDITISDVLTGNFVWVKDLAAFAEHLIEKSIKGGKFKYSAVNLACKEKNSNLALVEHIKSVVKSKSKINIISVGGGTFQFRCK